MWEHERDGLASMAYNTFSIQANVTSDGETSVSELQLAPGIGGLLRWFTDCGEPLQ